MFAFRCRHNDLLTIQRIQMSDSNLAGILTTAVDKLSDPQLCEGLFHPHRDGNPLPSGKVLEEIIALSRAVLFPGFYGYSQLNNNTLRYHIGVSVERLYRLLRDQIQAGLCFVDEDYCNSKFGNVQTREVSAKLATQMLEAFPSIKQTLATDVIAAYNGDPAAENTSEVIACYPIIKALTNYRIAHELSNLGVPLIPRMMTELAHSETGIDIHPNATIGKYFTVDHGTGVVIGATCVIGENVKIYQGVTLGAKSFPLDVDGNPIKGIPRHPIIGNNVIIYANATVLGRIRIGDGCVIGANTWVTEDMEADTIKTEKKENKK